MYTADPIELLAHSDAAQTHTPQAHIRLIQSSSIMCVTGARGWRQLPSKSMTLFAEWLGNGGSEWGRQRGDVEAASMTRSSAQYRFWSKQIRGIVQPCLCTQHRWTDGDVKALYCLHSAQTPHGLKHACSSSACRPIALSASLPLYVCLFICLNREVWLSLRLASVPDQPTRSIS